MSELQNDQTGHRAIKDRSQNIVGRGTRRVMYGVIIAVVSSVISSVITLVITKRYFTPKQEYCNLGFKAYYDKANTGQRYWQQINDDLWMELYHNPNNDTKFSLFRKIKHDTYSSCKGVVVQKLPIKAFNDQENIYSYVFDPPHNRQIFIPNDLSCSNRIMNRWNASSPKWDFLFEAYPLK